MIWLSPQHLTTINQQDELERLSRQWAMASSLLLIFAVFVLFTSKPDSLPMLSGRNRADNVINLELQVMQPQPEVIELSKPDQEPVIAEQVPPEPKPQPVMQQVMERQEPVPLEKIKPVNRKKKVVQQQAKPAGPVWKQIRPQPASRPAAAAAKPAITAKNTEETEPAAYEESMLDKVPAALFKEKPEYPYRARRMNVTGFVEMRFLVNNKGQVEELEIIRSRPKGVFETSVRKSVMNWRFTLGVKNGRSVATWITTTINFELE